MLQLLELTVKHMSSIDEVKAQLQTLTDAVNSLDVTSHPVSPDLTEFDTIDTDGNAKKYKVVAE
jgi:hypothetical protein